MNTKALYHRTGFLCLLSTSPVRLPYPHPRQVAPYQDYAANSYQAVRQARLFNYNKYMYNIKTSSTIPNKGNNKITELRTILQRESQNS